MKEYSWTEIWEYLAGIKRKHQKAETVPVQEAWGVVLFTTPAFVQVRLDSSEIVNVPARYLQNPRPKTRVRLTPTLEGQRMHFQAQPHRRVNTYRVEHVGIPTDLAFQGPQRFTDLWQPKLNRLHLNAPAFSATLLPQEHSEHSPRHSEPLDDLGVRHQHYLSFGNSSAWQKIDHQTRTAFRPEYSSGEYTIHHYVPGVNRTYQLGLFMESNLFFLPPPIGNRTLAQYLQGYPKITTETVFIDSQAYFHLGDGGARSGERIVYTNQGMRVDYDTGTETLESLTTSTDVSVWREATLYIETWRYLDPPLTFPRRAEKYRQPAGKLRIVMVYMPSWNWETDRFEPYPDFARWEAYCPITDGWWPVTNLVLLSEFTPESLGRLSPGGVFYEEADWVDPVPSCNPITGEFPDVPGGNERRGPEFDNAVLVSIPTGNTPPDPLPPVDHRPFFTSPNLGGFFSVHDAETYYGYGERLFAESHVKVNGQPVTGMWLYWAALRDVQEGKPDRQTLILCSNTHVQIHLHLESTLTLTWPEFFTELGLPADLEFKAATSPYAHHSFPLDRCHIAAEHPAGKYIIGLSHLDAWRDLGAAEWQEQDLSRPKSRLDYRTYLQEGGSVPTTRTGLVVSDVIPVPEIPDASKPAYSPVGEATEPLPFKAIEFRMLPVPRGETPARTVQSVEIMDFVGTAQQKAEAEALSLEALQKKMDLPLGWESQDEQNDQTYISGGKFKLTFDPIPVQGSTVIQLHGRAKGDLTGLKTPASPQPECFWLGRGLKPTIEGQEVPARGWRPFSLVIQTSIHPMDGLTLTLQLENGLQVSQLVWCVTSVKT